MEENKPVTWWVLQRDDGRWMGPRMDPDQPRSPLWMSCLDDAAMIPDVVLARYAANAFGGHLRRLTVVLHSVEEAIPASPSAPGRGRALLPDLED
jgi:hypothetical protein